MVWIGISILSISVKCQARNRTQKHAKKSIINLLLIEVSKKQLALSVERNLTWQGKRVRVLRLLYPKNQVAWEGEATHRQTQSEWVFPSLQHPTYRKAPHKARLTLSRRSRRSRRSHTWHEAGLFHIMSFIVEVITRTGSTSKCLNRRSVLQIEFGAQFKGKLTQIDLLQPQGNGQDKVCYPKWHAWQLGNDTLKG